MSPLLEARNLLKKGFEKNTVMFSEVSLEVRSQDICMIAGPSGCGKSILLKILASLEPFDEGEILFLDQPLCSTSLPAFRSTVLYLMQTPYFFPGISVLENLMVSFSLKSNRNKVYNKQILEEFLDYFAFSKNFLKNIATNLSGGQKQIANLLRALLLNPTLLLLDEPTAALDEETAMLVESYLARWVQKEKDRGLIWISHDRQQLNRMGGRVYHLQSDLQAAS